MGVGRVAFQVDVKVILPLAGARGGAIQNASWTRPCFFKRHQEIMDGTGRLGTEMTEAGAAPCQYGAGVASVCAAGK